jgi:NAD(P)H-dependent FMN reductase
MTRLVAIPGSLRRGSWNAALLRAAAEVAPAGTEIEVASLAGIPLYDADLEEAEGIPDAVSRLKDRIASADGLLLATPEYNAAVPGVLKNAVDWLSRPPADIARVFGGKPVAIVGATPGLGGTRLAQAAWLSVLRALGARLWSGRSLYLAGAAQAFDAEGRLTDPKVRKFLADLVAGFAAFAAT